MEHSNEANAEERISKPGRRMILAGMLATYAASLIPWAAAEPVSGAEHGAFVALSAIIAGRQALDTAMAKRLYDAFVVEDASFAKACVSLLALIEERKIDVRALQQTLDGEHSQYARLPPKIATAWFMGIVGTGDKAKALAYEKALNAEIVSDVLKPPSYSYGGYGSWTKAPI